MTNALYFKGSAKDVDAEVARLIGLGYTINGIAVVSVSQFLILATI